MLSWLWEYMHIIPGPRILGQEDHDNLKANLVYIESSRFKHKRKREAGANVTYSLV